MKKIILLFSILSCYHVVKAQSGFPDPSFGNNGYISTYAPQVGLNFTSIARQCFIQGDGKLILVLQAGGKTRLARRLSNGNVDASYANNGYSPVVSMSITAAAMQADGKIVVAGTTNGSTDFMLARYNTDGQLDISFGNGGIVISDMGSESDFLRAVIITTDNKIIAGGSTRASGSNQFVLVRYTSSGMIDPGFGISGVVNTDFNSFSSTLSSLALQPDGKIIAAGGSFNNDGNNDFALARYNADGSADLTFNGTGKKVSDFTFGDFIQSVAVNNDGKICVGGQTSGSSGYPQFTIARYNSDGSPDLNFNPGTGLVTVAFGSFYDYLLNIRIQSDGKIVAAGHANRDDLSHFDIALTRINTNGTIDNSFGTNGNGRVTTNINLGNEESDYLVIQQDGKIITGGVHQVVNDPALSRFSGFRYNTDGTPDAGFGNGGYFTDFIAGSAVNYYSLFEQNDGKLLAYGESNSTTAKQFISRFNPDGTPDNSYGQNGNSELNFVSGTSFFQPDGKLLRTGHSFTNNGDIMLLRYNSDGTPDAGFGNGGTVLTDFGGSESVSVIAFQPDGKFIAGGALRDNNGSDFLVIRYNTDGSVDASFGNGGYVRMNFLNEESFQSVAIAADGKIVLGGTSLTFPPYFNRLKFYAVIVRLNPNGSFDTNFGDQGKSVIDKSDYDNIGNVLVQNDNKIVYSRYSNGGGATQHVFMERLNANGSPDNSFGQGGSVACDGGFMVKQANQKILVLGFKINNRNNTDFTLARFNANGIADLSFGTNGKTTASFTQLDNFLFNGYLAGNAFFASGGGVDQMGANPGIIAKFGLGPELEQGISCPGNQFVNTDIDRCGANIYEIDPVTIPGDAAVKYDLSGATTGSGNGSVSGFYFNTGITTITYSLADDPSKSCSFNVTVQDNKPPVINDLGVSQAILWPPNHAMKDINVNYSIGDNCGVANTVVTVSSNEPVQGTENNDQSPDWQILDNHHIRLRAERLGSGNGRVYSIKVTVTDVNGNQQTATTSVNVPKSTGTSGQELVVTASPNPSSSYFLVTINSKANDKVRVRILDNNGTALNTLNNVSAQQTLAIGHELKAGIYILEVVQAGVIKTTRIVKQ